VKKLKQAMGNSKVKNSKKSTASGKNSEVSSEGSGEEDEEVADLPVAMQSQKKPAPRMSVSAEVFGKFNVEQEYKPPVHPKSEDQKKAIRDKMSKNFMFSCLNPKDK
jgi:cAMP-dependent protein kinase regulator